MTKDKFITECIKHANTINQMVDFDSASRAWQYLVENGLDASDFEDLEVDYLDGEFGMFRPIPRICW